MALVERNQPGETRYWIDKLNDIAPATLGNLVLRVRVLLELGDLESAEDEITNQIIDPTATDAATRNIVAAAQFVSLHRRSLEDDPGAANDWLSKAEALLSDPVVQDSELSLELTLFLARQDRMGNALEHFESETRGVADYQLARAAETLMLLVKEPGHLERLAGVLSSVLQEQPDSALLRLALADVQNWLGQYDKAESNYRAVIEQAPESVNALNNLAFLLAIQKRDLEEAEELVGKAQDLMGPQPALLDSEALVLMAQRRYAEAASILDVAIGSAPNNALYLIHRAEARIVLDPKAAKQDLQSAQNFGVADLPLHPSDRQRLQQLESQL